MNRAAFGICIGTQPAPPLQPGDAGIAGTLSSRKSAWAKELLTAHGNRLLFPPA